MKNTNPLKISITTIPGTNQHAYQVRCNPCARNLTIKDLYPYLKGVVTAFTGYSPDQKFLSTDSFYLSTIHRLARNHYTRHHKNVSTP